jgi:hypothetical protein
VTGVETLSLGGRVLAYVVRADASAEATSFVTPGALNLQLGFVVYPRGGRVPAHRHRPLPRTTTGTAEAVLVRSGRCEVDLYDAARARITCALGPGDLILILGGGHGFRMLEDTVLLEIKQGPYLGLPEKEALEP